MLQKLLVTFGVGVFLLFGFWGFVSPPTKADVLRHSETFMPTPTPTPSPTVSPTVSPSPDMSPSPTVSPSITPEP